MEEPDSNQLESANQLEDIPSPSEASADAHDVDDEESDNQQSSCNASFQESTVVSPAPSDSTHSTTTTDNCDNSSVAGQGSEMSEDKPTSTAKLKLKDTQANSSDDDDDDEDDPDFDPTPSTNTPQENLSEEDSDGEVEEGENHNKRSNSPSLQPSRKRPASTALGVISSGSLVNKKFKARKLVSVNSSRQMTLPPGIPRTRITFLSGKPSDIGLADLRKTGLSGVLAALRSQKQTKLTTLEKSRHDWQAFKQAEGLEDELRSQVKGRNGFLDKRDFLERTDHRQFEREKEMRNKHRRNPLGS